jgi:hypothetical protein
VGGVFMKKLRTLIFIGAVVLAASSIAFAGDATVVVACSVAAEPVQIATMVDKPKEAQSPLHTQAFFDDLDKSIATHEYQKTSQQIEAALHVYPATYSLEWLKTLSDKFLVIYEGFMAYVQPSFIDSPIDHLVCLAERIATAYRDEFNEHGLAVHFLETFFFKSLNPQCVVSYLLYAHDKNGSLKEGCDFVWRYVVALANQDTAHDVYSALLFTMAPDVVSHILDFCMKVDPEMVVVWGKDFVDHTFNKNHLKTVVANAERLLTPFLEHCKKFAQRRHGKLQPATRDLYDAYPLHSLGFSQKTLGSCCDLIYRNKQYFAQYLSAMLEGVKVGIANRILCGFTKVCIKTARAMQEVGRMEEARSFLRNVYYKYKECGFDKAAEGLAAYAAACPQSYQEAEKFEDEYAIYVGCAYGAPDTLRYLKKDTFVF